MAPRKPAAAPTGTPTRRSNRIAGRQAEDPLAAVTIPGSVTNRVTKKTAAIKAKPTKQECVSCSRHLARSSFPTELVADKCAHAVNTCKQCVKSWIAVQVDSVTYDNLSCPECPELLTNADVKRLAVDAVYQRFDSLERRGVANKIPGWRWCLNPHCREGQVHQPLAKVDESDDDIQIVTAFTNDEEVDVPTSKYPKVLSQRKNSTTNDDHLCICKGCGAKACVGCDRPYHEGETCEEYQERRKRQTEAEEEATKQTIENKCRKCPNPLCGKNIEKNGGCDAVLCTQCRTHFCYLCLRPYSEINKSGHAAGCVYTAAGAFDPHAAPTAPNGLGLMVIQGGRGRVAGQGLFGGPAEVVGPAQIVGPVQVVPQRPGAIPGIIQGALMGLVQHLPAPIGFAWHNDRGGN